MGASPTFSRRRAECLPVPLLYGSGAKGTAVPPLNGTMFNRKGKRAHQGRGAQRCRHLLQPPWVTSAVCLCVVLDRDRDGLKEEELPLGSLQVASSSSAAVATTTVALDGSIVHWGRS